MYRVSDTVRSTQSQDGAIVLDVQHVDQISREFGVSRDLAENDVREFLHNLKKSHLVEEHEPGVPV